MSLKDALRWLWIAAVLIFAAWYGFRNWESIGETASSVPATAMVAAAVLIFMAKGCIVAIARLAATSFDIHLSWSESFRFYHQSQMGKYIPGSIWQFVGRAAMLRDKGATGRGIRDALLAEQVWLLGMAAFLALLLVPTGSQGYKELISNWPLATPWTIFLAAVILAVPVTVLITSLRVRLWARRLVPPLSAIPLGAISWAFFGLSMWVLVPSNDQTTISLAYVVGAYALAYLVGFAVPFAPAGLGIREATLVLALGPYVGTSTALFLAVANRMIYFLTELLIVGALSLAKLRSARSAESFEEPRVDSQQNQDPASDAGGPHRPTGLS